MVLNILNIKYAETSIEIIGVFCYKWHVSSIRKKEIFFLIGECAIMSKVVIK